MMRKMLPLALASPAASVAMPGAAGDNKRNRTMTECPSQAGASKYRSDCIGAS